MRSLRQVKDLINNMAKQKDINAQILLRNYMMERLLERIALSEFKDKFILKGGMLVAALVGVDMRSTIDMDATIKNYPVTLESIEKAFESILQVEVDDGVTIKIKKINEIRDEDEYHGFQISLDAKMENARIPMKIDITTGDKITPKEVTYKFDLLLEERSIEVLAYNVETVIAEKLETLIVRSFTNTRMRDFYDLYILLKLQGQNINGELLGAALAETAKRRNSVKDLSVGEQVIKEIFQEEILQDYWRKYQKEYNYAEDISWEEVKNAVESLWSMSQGNK